MHFTFNFPLEKIIFWKNIIIYDRNWSFLLVIWDKENEFFLLIIWDGGSTFLFQVSFFLKMFYKMIILLFRLMSVANKCAKSYVFNEWCITHTHVSYPIFFYWMMYHIHIVSDSCIVHMLASLMEINQEIVINIGYDGLKEMYYRHFWNICK